jgi:hypothetical protein
VIINVKFKKRNGDGFGGRAYSYYCNIPTVKVGDVVKVPTVSGDSVAQICAVDVPEYKVDERVLPLLKTVTEFAADAASVNSQEEQLSIENAFFRGGTDNGARE